MNETPNYEARLYLNGFPKAGTHLLAMLCHACFAPLEGVQDEAHPAFAAGWSGTYTKHSFSSERVPLEWTTYQISRLRHGTYLKAHAGWSKELAEFLRLTGTAHVFVYRDLRDVAVSQTFHILNDGNAFKHSDKERYRALGGFDEILSAVIMGLDDEYRGLVARWEEYAPWLDDDDTLALRFEDLRYDPAPCCEQILSYAYARAPQIYGVERDFVVGSIQQYVDAMVEMATHRESSPTFRKGESGGWVEHFKSRHHYQFDQTGGQRWLRKLGYTEQDDVEARPKIRVKDLPIL